MQRNGLMITLAASSLLLAQISSAQMMGGGSPHTSPPSNGSSSTNPGSMGPGTTNPGSTNPGSMGPGMTGSGPMGPGMNGMPGGMDAFGAMQQTLVVSTDGVLYTMRTAAPAGQTPSFEVVAVRPSGTSSWTAKLDGTMGRLALSGNLVLAATGSASMGLNGSTGGSQSADQHSQLVALSAASGTTQWTLSLDGFVMTVEPFSGGTYVMLVKVDTTNAGSGMPSGATGTMSMSRKLMAIDNSGKVTWSLDLN